jgi:glucokinase
MYLGIEIGATKLQFGVEPGDGSPLVALERLDVLLDDGAAGIRRQMELVVPGLVRRHSAKAIGIGFGGPVNPVTGRTITSHQVEGWDDFPLVDWCQATFDLPTAIANDSDSAGLAEALFGAGRGHRVVFYTNVGSGIGGALVIDGHIYSGSRGIASEIGHIRPGLHAQRPDQTVESISSGFGIAAAAQGRLAEPGAQPIRPLVFGQGPPDPGLLRQRLADHEEAEAVFLADLRQRCGGKVDELTARMVAQAAADGNAVAQQVLDHAVQTYGWAIAQMVTLLAPEVVVIGGGVPQMGESLFLGPLRREVDRYGFPPLKGTFRIAPAELGEEVVVHGALAVAGGAQGVRRR